MLEQCMTSGVCINSHTCENDWSWLNNCTKCRYKDTAVAIETIVEAYSCSLCVQVYIGYISQSSPRCYWCESEVWGCVCSSLIVSSLQGVWTGSDYSPAPLSCPHLACFFLELLPAIQTTPSRPQGIHVCAKKLYVVSISEPHLSYPEHRGIPQLAYLLWHLVRFYSF